MSKDPLVSIVVPVYNVSHYVEKCIESLTGQTYKNLEIIIVDDGSTDTSGKICDELAKHDRRIKVHHKTNGGLSSARNFGIKLAKGEYICLVDSDDYVKNDFVRKMIYKAEIKNADIVVCGFNNETPMARTVSGDEAAVRLLTKQENVDIVAWNKMYRKELFNEIKYPVGENYEDTLTTYKLYAEAETVAYLADSLYEYVVREGSITGDGKKIERLTAREKAAQEGIRYFAENDGLKQAAEIAMLTAKIAWIDFALNGMVDKKYGSSARKWICNNAKKYVNNIYMTGKLKLYVKMICNFGGVGYKLFRKIRHE